MSNCAKMNCCTKSKSNIGFFVAMLCVVAIGGGTYLYLDATVFAPVDAQEQTTMNNPGVGHPPKNKRHNTTNTTVTTSRSDAATGEK
jgi:hypothetical protein